MSNEPQASQRQSAEYLAIVQLILELHRLTIAGMDESPAADLVRDAADLPWQALTEVEKNRVRDLSEALYSISDQDHD